MSMFDKLLANSIYNLKDNSRKNKKKKKLKIIKVRTASGKLVRIYKKRKGCGKVKSICIVCLANEATEGKHCRVCLPSPA